MYGSDPPWRAETQFTATHRGQDGRINLSSNELLHERLELLQGAVCPGNSPRLASYPRTGRAAEALAALLGLPTESFVLTPGSDCAVRLLLTGLVGGGEWRGPIVLPEPNYESWRDVARWLGVPVVPVVSATCDPSEYLHGLCEAVGSTRDALVVVSVPNGPAGWSFDPTQLDELAEACRRRGHLLVVDACYHVFDGPLGWLFRYAGRHVVVLASLSKSHGLAGARLAVVTGDRTVLATLAAMNVEGMVSAQAVGAAERLAPCAQALAEIWEDVRAVREQVGALLAEQGFAVLRSGGNFLNVRVGDDGAARRVERGLSDRGYRVRVTSGLPGLSGCIRFTVGDRGLMDAFVPQLIATAAATADR